MAAVARWRHLSLKEDLEPYAIFDPPRGLPRPWILLKAVINYPGNRDRKIDLCIKRCFKEAKIIKKNTATQPQESLDYTNSYSKFDKILLN